MKRTHHGHLEPEYEVWNTQSQPIQIRNLSEMNNIPISIPEERPDQELHWGNCTDGPCAAVDGGIWFCVEDGGMYAYHKAHIADPSAIEACEALRETYKAKYLSE